MVSSNSIPGIQAASNLSAIIDTAPYESVLFEGPGTSWQSSEEDPFQFVIIGSPTLRRFAGNSHDRDGFAEHFCSSYNSVCTFANRDGNMPFIAPLPQRDVDDSVYSYLSDFIRQAPKSQVFEFWRVSASKYLEVLKQKNEVDPDAKTW